MPSPKKPKPVSTRKLRRVLSLPSLWGLPFRAEFLAALDELDKLRAEVKPPRS